MKNTRTKNPKNPNPCAVLIVEDRVHTAEKFAAAVKSDHRLNLAGIAYDLDTALHMLACCKPRVVLTDLGLPDGSGIDVIRAANQADWLCESLVVSVFGDEARVFRALRAGARGYVQKTDTAANIVTAICELVDGGSPMSPKIARLLLTEVGEERRGAQLFDQGHQLSTREFEVLELIVKGLKRKEIAERLGITIGTVGSHIHKIYTKLNVTSNTAAILAAAKMRLL